MGINRGCPQNDSLADGCRRPEQRSLNIRVGVDQSGGLEHTVADKATFTDKAKAVSYSNLNGGLANGGPPELSGDPGRDH